MIIRGLFLCLVWGWLLPGQAAAACKIDRSGEPVTVSWIYDGDTLKLTDGRKVRLIGINTPEKGRNGQPDEPGAAAASAQLQSLVDGSERRLLLRIGEQPRDRYHRLLADIYDSQGHNLTEQLLRKGAGFVIAIPPNLANLTCYKQAEAWARAHGLGIWRHTRLPVAAEDLQGDETGFKLLKGRIARVGRSRKSLWLNLQNGPAIRIDWSDWDYFEGWEPQSLAGRRLEVRGWLYLSRGRQRMRIRHPAAVHWLD